MLTNHHHTAWHCKPICWTARSWCGSGGRTGRQGPVLADRRDGLVPALAAASGLRGRKWGRGYLR